MPPPLYHVPYRIVPHGTDERTQIANVALRRQTTTFSVENAIIATRQDLPRMFPCRRAARLRSFSVITCLESGWRHALPDNASFYDRTQNQYTLESCTPLPGNAIGHNSPKTYGNASTPTGDNGEEWRLTRPAASIAPPSLRDLG